MITRTSINAEVEATVVQKTEDGIQQNEISVVVDKCTSKAKAEIALSKIYKNAIVDITGITFYADKRVMSESDFEKYSTLKEHTVLTPEEIEHINESRKRGNK